MDSTQGSGHLLNICYTVEQVNFDVLDIWGKGCNVLISDLPLIPHPEAPLVLWFLLTALSQLYNNAKVNS